MSRIKNELAVQCEFAMMGKVIRVNHDDIPMMTQYILSALGCEDNFKDLDIIKDRICKYSEYNKVTHIVCNTILDGMRCITYLLECTSDDEEEKYPAPFEEDYGSGYPCAFCYCFNVDADNMCSEFGDCFFEKQKDGCYHRVS